MEVLLIYEIKTTTPSSITDDVINLCKDFGEVSKLQYVNVIPEQEATISNCFPNVKDTVIRKGGSQIYGWAIWKWANILIEAEAHSVWKRPDGKLIDVTPHQGGEKSILFIEDMSMDYKGNIVKSRRKALTASPLVEEYIKLAEEKEDIIYRTTGDIVSLPTSLLRRMYELSIIFKTKVERNVPCPCQSGLKYKKCCGR